VARDHRFSPQRFYRCDEIIIDDFSLLLKRSDNRLFGGCLNLLQRSFRPVKWEYARNFD
jgi:hypothetical protein